MDSCHHILQRTTVYNELDNYKKYPLLIVTAPMGYGKSTAVRDYLSNTHVNNIWIQLNEASKNTGYFWSLLSKRISEVNKGLGNTMLSLDFPEDSIQKGRFIDCIKANMPLDNFVLVFDDYQFAENDKLNILLQSVIKEEIPNFHIIIVSRHMPQINFTELLVKSLAYQINSRLLRFSNTDVRRYFSLMSMPLNKEQVIKVQKIADGWIAALYLVYRGMKEGVPLENITEIKDLLKDSLYEYYDDDTKSVLCILSLLDDFTIELASYASSMESISEIIDKLCIENAFINHDSKKGIYTIHSVFRDFLKNQAKKMELDIKDIYSRAGYWYIEQNNISQAFHYLFLGEDYETMLKELEKPSLYIKASDRPMMFYYFDAIPELYKDNHPIACLKFILLFIISGDKNKGKNLLTKFENELTYKNFNENDKIEIEAAIHIIKNFLSFNNLDLMLYHIGKILDLLKGNASVIASFDGPFSFGSPHLTYIYYKEIGTYQKISGMPLENYAKVSGGGGKGSEALCRAEYALETGDFNNVEVEALKSIYQAKTKNQTSMIVCASFTLARLYIYQEKHVESLSLLTSLNDMVTDNIESILLNTYDLCIGYIYACIGEYSKIPKWIRDGDMSINSLMIQGAVFSYVVYGKALILSDNWPKAEALCETFIPYFKIFNNQLGLLHNYIHLAIASFKRNNEQKSKMWLKMSLEIGQSDNIIMPFVENGDNLIPLLICFEINDGINMSYISKLIILCTEYSSITANKKIFNNPLSSREVEALKLISLGFSRSEIAEKMIVSPGTVRTHIQNIYLKLSVNKKREAINKAKELNII